MSIFLYRYSISRNISFLTSLNSSYDFLHFFKIVIYLSSVFLFLLNPYLLYNSCGMLMLNIPLDSYLNESLLVLFNRSCSVLGNRFIFPIQFFFRYIIDEEIKLSHLITLSCLVFLKNNLSICLF